MKHNLWNGQENIGFIVFHVHEKNMYLEWTYIKPEFRRYGNWRRTIQEFMELSNNNGFRIFIDFVDHLTDKSPTDYVTQDFQREFYLGLGFTPLFRYGSENERTRLCYPSYEKKDDEDNPEGAFELLIQDRS